MEVEFDAWWLKEGKKLVGDDHIEGEVYVGWCAAWKASRAALVIELPALYCADPEARGYEEDCREAIQAAGVTVK